MKSVGVVKLLLDQPVKLMFFMYRHLVIKNILKVFFSPCIYVRENVCHNIERQLWQSAQNTENVFEVLGSCDRASLT